MSSSFSQLLRNSRLSKFDPKLSQVYKTFGEYHKLGDYGVKRNLPKHLRTNVITINSMDTMEHQTPYNSAETLIRFKRKWNENFLFSKTVEPLKSNDVHQRNFLNISKLSNKDFKKLLKKIEKRKNDWNQLLITTSYESNNWLEFLGLTYDTKSSNSTIKGLTYSHNNPGVNFQVQGRILNKDSNGIFAIGISGLVGSLHFGKAQRLAQVNRKKLDHFYLEKVEFDDHGRPNIRVSHTPLLSTQNDFSSLLDHYPGKSSLFFDSATSRIKDNEKTQEEILSRLRSLLKTSSTTSNDDDSSSSKPSFQLVYEEMFPSKVNNDNDPKVNNDNEKSLFQILSENKENDDSTTTTTKNMEFTDENHASKNEKF